MSFRHVVLGLVRTLMAKSWLKPSLLVGGGHLLGLAQAISAYFVTGTLFGNVDYGKMLGLTQPKGFAISTSLFFEVAIMFAIFGGAILLIDSLSEPRDQPKQNDPDGSATTA